MMQRYKNTAVPSKQTGAFYAAYFGVLGVVLPFLGPFLSGRGLGAVAVGPTSHGVYANREMAFSNASIVRIIPCRRSIFAIIR